MINSNEIAEIRKVRDRYERRKDLPEKSLYSMLNPSVYMAVQEKERAIIQFINFFHLEPLCDKRILEIGCGTGLNLLGFIKLGFRPEHIIGNELLEERAELARKFLPKETKILIGDASTLELEENSFDIVYQSTVFTSILDNDFKKRLANKMWSLAKPGGGVLWYDFIYDNPYNPDVRGVSLKHIQELFPNSKITTWKITLAPPISRFVTKFHPNLYNAFNLFPFFRTHVLAWIAKES